MSLADLIPPLWRAHLLGACVGLLVGGAGAFVLADGFRADPPPVFVAVDAGLQ